MPDVHVPKLDEHEEEEPVPPAGGPVSTPHRRSRSFVKIGLEVVLISAGVFLGLMGEQWRERSEHRELAEESLRRFRTEITTNRAALMSQKDYHATLKQELATLFASDAPMTQARMSETVNMTMGVGPIFFEQAAWDVALATQALAYIDADLAFRLSRVYTVQQEYAGLQRAIVQSTIYGRSWTQDFEGVFRSILNYMGDVSYFDPTLLKAYDEVLPQIDRALGEAPSKELP
jgi:hypothetical protein